MQLTHRCCGRLEEIRLESKGILKDDGLQDGLVSVSVTSLFIFSVLKCIELNQGQPWGHFFEIGGLIANA